MKKLTEQETKLFKKIVFENNSMIEMDNKRYYVSLVEKPEATIHHFLKATTDTKRKYQQTKKDILEGKGFSLDDVVEMMDVGAI